MLNPPHVHAVEGHDLAVRCASAGSRLRQRPRPVGTEACLWYGLISGTGPSSHKDGTFLADLPGAVVSINLVVGPNCV
jgi:hypothetical protein